MNLHLHAKRILCYGDSLTFGKVPGPTKRYPANERWTGILQNLLGDDYEIIEEGLRGRTTNLEDDKMVGRNGLPYFQSCVLSHLPLDLIIILLGTNDLKEKFNRSAKEIATVFKEYKEAIKIACTYLEEPEPKLLLLSPPLVDESYALAEWGFSGGEEKSRQLATEYANVAKIIDADFLDLSPFITPSSIDGIHLEKDANTKIAEELSKKIKELL